MKFTNKKILLILAVLILVGFYLRVVLVGKTDFWFDEAFTGTAIRESWGEMFNILINDKVHPPFYYVLLKSWGAVLGYNYESLRVFSLIWGVLLIPVTYVFGTLLSKDELKQKLIGFTAAGLVTFSPYFIAYSVEARSYSLLMVIGALTAITFVKALNTSPYRFNRYWAATLVLLALSLLTHYMSIIHIALITLAYVIYVLIDRGLFKRAKLWQALLSGSFIVYLGLILIFSSAFVKKYVDLVNGRMWWVTPANFSTVIKSFYAFLFGVDRQANLVPPVYKLAWGIDPMTVAVIIFVIVILSLAVFISKNKNNKSNLFLVSYLTLMGVVSLCLVAMLSDLGLNIYVERYLSIYGWYMLILVAFLAIEVWNKQAIMLGAIYLLLVSAVVLPPSTHPFSKTRDFVQGQIKPKQIFICDVGGDFVILRYYFDQYAKTTYMYSPKNYATFTKSEILNTSGIVKDLSNAQPGDIFICGERRGSRNRILINQIDKLNIYQFK